MGSAVSVLSVNNKVNVNNDDYKITVHVDSEKEDRVNYRLGLNQFVKASFTKSNQLTCLKRLLKNTDFLTSFLKFLNSDYVSLKSLSASDTCIIKNTMINLNRSSTSVVQTYSIDENDTDTILPTICVVHAKKKSTKPTHGSLMVMVAIKYLDRFLQTYYYKIWRAQADLKEDYLIKALNKVLESSECSDLEAELFWRNPNQLFKAFSFVHPNHFTKMSQSPYISSLLGTVESLPYGVSISVVEAGSKNPGTLAYVNEMYANMSSFVRSKDFKSINGKQLENITEGYLKEVLKSKAPYCTSLKVIDEYGIQYKHMMGSKVITSASGKCQYLISLRFDVTLESTKEKNSQDIRELLDMLPSTIE